MRPRPREENIYIDKTHIMNTPIISNLSLYGTRGYKFLNTVAGHI